MSAVWSVARRTRTGPPTRIVEAAISTETMFKASSLTPELGTTIRRLAKLSPSKLAVMHGSCFEGDCSTQLERLADFYDGALEAAWSSAHG